MAMSAPGEAKPVLPVTPDTALQGPPALEFTAPEHENAGDQEIEERIAGMAVDRTLTDTAPDEDIPDASINDNEFATDILDAFKEGWRNHSSEAYDKRTDPRRRAELALDIIRSWLPQVDPIDEGDAYTIKIEQRLRDLGWNSYFADYLKKFNGWNIYENSKLIVEYRPDTFVEACLAAEIMERLSMEQDRDETALKALRDLVNAEATILTTTTLLKRIAHIAATPRHERA